MPGSHAQRGRTIATCCLKGYDTKINDQHDLFHDLFNTSCSSTVPGQELLTKREEHELHAFAKDAKQAEGTSQTSTITRLQEV